jgi:hypothetical protein
VTGNSTATGIEETSIVKPDYTIYPNPSSGKLFISFANKACSAYYVRIVDALGRTMYMLPRPLLENGIDVSGLSAGVYELQLTDDKTKITISKKFIKE